MSDETMREALYVRNLLKRDLDELRLFQLKFLSVQHELRDLGPGQDERAMDICRLLSNSFVNCAEIQRAAIHDLLLVTKTESLSLETREYVARIVLSLGEDFVARAMGSARRGVVKIEEDPS